MWKWRKLEVTGSFFLLITFALAAGAGPVLPQAALAATCHEAGHLAALRITGIRVTALRLTGKGAELQADTRYLGYGREIFCCLAGPAVNLVLAVALARWTEAYVMAGAHLLLGLFNLLPLPDLDGGQTLYLLISWLTNPLTADRICRVVGLALAIVLTAGAFMLVLCHHTGLFLLAAALGCLWPQLPFGERWTQRFT